MFKLFPLLILVLVFTIQLVVFNVGVVSGTFGVNSRGMYDTILFIEAELSGIPTFRDNRIRDNDYKILIDLKEKFIVDYYFENNVLQFKSGKIPYSLNNERNWIFNPEASQSTPQQVIDTIKGWDTVTDLAKISTYKIDIDDKSYLHGITDQTKIDERNNQVREAHKVKWLGYLSDNDIYENNYEGQLVSLSSSVVNMNIPENSPLDIMSKKCYLQRYRDYVERIKDSLISSKSFLDNVNSRAISNHYSNSPTIPGLLDPSHPSLVNLQKLVNENNYPHPNPDQDISKDVMVSLFQHNQVMLLFKNIVLSLQGKQTIKDLTKLYPTKTKLDFWLEIIQIRYEHGRLISSEMGKIERLLAQIQQTQNSIPNRRQLEINKKVLDSKITLDKAKSMSNDQKNIKLRDILDKFFPTNDDQILKENAMRDLGYK